MTYICTQNMMSSFPGQGVRVVSRAMSVPIVTVADSESKKWGPQRPFSAEDERGDIYDKVLDRVRLEATYFPLTSCKIRTRLLKVHPVSDGVDSRSKWALEADHLAPDKCEAVGGENPVDGLEVGSPAGLAVARASRDDTLGLGAGV